MLPELTIRNFTRCILMLQFYMLQHIPPLLWLVRAIRTHELGRLATVQWLFLSVWFPIIHFINKDLGWISTHCVSDWQMWWPTHPANIHYMFGFLSLFTQPKTFICFISRGFINTQWLRSCKTSIIQSPLIMLHSSTEFYSLNGVYLQN
jgi:hypothetical protein